MTAETAERATRRAGFRAHFVALLVLALGGVMSWGASWFIEARFPDRPAPRDTLFELLPYSDASRYVMMAALLVSLGIFLWYGFIAVPDQTPRLLAVFGVMYVLRSVLNILTPLANAHGEGPFVFPAVQNGMFPSGHAAAVLLFVLLTDAGEAPRIWWMQAGLATVVVVTLLLAHGHYSIDIAGGLLLGYFCEREWSRGTLFNPLKRAIAADERAGRRT